MSLRPKSASEAETAIADRDKVVKELALKTEDFEATVASLKTDLTNSKAQDGEELNDLHTKLAKATTDTRAMQITDEAIAKELSDTKDLNKKVVDKLETELASTQTQNRKALDDFQSRLDNALTEAQLSAQARDAAINELSEKKDQTNLTITKLTADLKAVNSEHKQSLVALQAKLENSIAETGAARAARDAALKDLMDAKATTAKLETELQETRMQDSLAANDLQSQLAKNRSEVDASTVAQNTRHLSDTENEINRPKTSVTSTHSNSVIYKNFKSYDNEDLGGGDLSKISTDDVQSCTAACRQETRCLAFTIDKWNHICLLRCRRNECWN